LFELQNKWPKSTQARAALCSRELRLAIRGNSLFETVLSHPENSMQGCAEG
jgi:hypothetical protein